MSQVSRFGDWFFGRKGSPRPEAKDPGPPRNPDPSDLPDGYVMTIKEWKQSSGDGQGLRLSINGPGIDHDEHYPDPYKIDVEIPSWFEGKILRQTLKAKVRRAMWKLADRSKKRWKQVRDIKKVGSELHNLKDDLTGGKRSKGPVPQKPPAPRGEIM